MGAAPLAEPTNTATNWQKGTHIRIPSKMAIGTFHKQKTFAKFSLSENGPALWNTLSNEPGATNDIEQFKAKLKTHLFSKF